MSGQGTSQVLYTDVELPSSNGEWCPLFLVILFFSFPYYSNRSLSIACNYLCEERSWFQSVGYDYRDYMDFMDLAVYYRRKAVKLKHSLAHSIHCGKKKLLGGNEFH